MQAQKDLERVEKLGRRLFERDVVHQRHRPCTDAQHVVDVHRDAVDTDRVEAPGRLRHQELGANAVGRDRHAQVRCHGDHVGEVANIEHRARADGVREGGAHPAEQRLEPRADRGELRHTSDRSPSCAQDEARVAEFVHGVALVLGVRPGALEEGGGSERLQEPVRAEQEPFVRTVRGERPTLIEPIEANPDLQALAIEMRHNPDPRIKTMAQWHLDRMIRYATYIGGWNYYDFVAGTQTPSMEPTSFGAAAGLVALSRDTVENP